MIPYFEDGVVRIYHGDCRELIGKLPDEKPVGVLLPLIEYSCPYGGTVIDLFMGSGSALEAARLIGRNAIGIDVDERCCEAAAKRLSQASLQLGA
jgi:site-specific DNA-methyltransferase (adenine-specific)